MLFLIIFCSDNYPRLWNTRKSHNRTSLNPTKLPMLQIPCVKRACAAILVTCQITRRICIQPGMYQHHGNACGLHLSLLSQTKGVYPPRTPQFLSAQQWTFKTCLLNVWAWFLSNTGPSTRTVAGHINKVCRSVKQFVSVLSLHAWGELTANSNTLFAKCDSSHPENLGSGTGFVSTLMVPSTPPLCVWMFGVIYQTPPHSAASTCRAARADCLTAAEDHVSPLLRLMVPLTSRVCL